MTAIEDFTFWGATSLASVTSPQGLVSIGECAFFNARSLAALSFPNSLTHIGDAAFDSATALTSVNIPNGVTYIGTYTFYGNTSLESITIPSTVVEIGEEAFMESTSLANVYFSGNAPGTMGPGAFSTVANGARARILPGATGFGVDGSYWNGLLVQRDSNPPNNTQQTSVQPEPLRSLWIAL